MRIKHTIPIFLLLSLTVNAKSYVYITDTVPIPMRSENQIADNIIKTLDSGTKLEILATENGWTKIKFENTIGWIISRYLTSNIPAIVQLKKLKQNNNDKQLLLSRENKINAKLEKQVTELRAKNTKLSIEYGKIQSEKQHIQQTYKNSLKLEHTNKKLKTRVLQLKTELQLLQNNNTVVRDSSSRNWFIVGALVLFFGFIIGFLISKFTNQRRI